MPRPSGLASMLKWLCKVTTMLLIRQRHQLELHLNMLGSMHKWQCKVTMMPLIHQKSQLHLSVLENMLRWQCRATMRVVFEHQVHSRNDWIYRALHKVSGSMHRWRCRIMHHSKRQIHPQTWVNLLKWPCRIVQLRMNKYSTICLKSMVVTHLENDLTAQISQEMAELEWMPVITQTISRMMVSQIRFWDQ